MQLLVDNREKEPLKLHQKVIDIKFNNQELPWEKSEENIEIDKKFDKEMKLVKKLKNDLKPNEICF